MSKKCRFSKPNGECSLLYDTYCAGINTACSFYKTDEQFIEDRNHATEINRMKGNCVNCRYCGGKKCELIPKGDDI